MLAKNIADRLKGSSWIRDMFEKGERLRQKYGIDNVYDFSLGNPDIEPPESVKIALRSLADSKLPGMHKYMSNAGLASVREKIAAHIKANTGIDLKAEHIVMACGAAGGLNVVLKTILDPGDEVIIFAPYFPEYKTYIDNHSGVPVISTCNTATFMPDLDELEKKLSPRTKAIILNTPNNPTGVVYNESILKSIADLLNSKERQYGTRILVISDEPYASIVFDNIEAPNIMKIFENSVTVTSCSKSLALPGERIGWIAVNPAMGEATLLVSGLVYSTRALGFVNAPALFQRVVAGSLEETVDPDVYKERRDILYDQLIKAGYECVKPQGAFYLFPRSPMEDDIQFVNQAAEYNILVVPGTAFGCPGHFRIAYCVSLETIEKSLDAFKALIEDCRRS
ncbi:MAG TPA: pyridoxal phosphate-dependent aminotransferase [Candidatus Atribacteria bacterium]|nr:pyridoxal phosphate-dependent aminotransferase [Candidatus Atribacteria bacterium]